MTTVAVIITVFLLEVTFVAMIASMLVVDKVWYYILAGLVWAISATGVIYLLLQIT